MFCLSGQEKSVAATGAMKSLLGNADARGAPIHAVEPGNENTFGGLLVRLQNVVRSIAALNRDAPPSAETARSITSKH